MSAPSVFPDDWPTVWLAGRYANPDGTPATGRLLVVANLTGGRLVDPGARLIVRMAAFTRDLDTGGDVAVALPPTDGPGLVTTGWTYTVHDPTGGAFPLSLPSTAPVLDEPGHPLHGQRVVWLSDVVPAPAPSGGTVQLVRGRGVDTVTVDQSGHLIVGFDDDTEHDAGYIGGGGSGGPTTQLRAQGIAASVLSGHRVVTPGPSGLVYADNQTAAHLAAPLWLTTGAAAQGAAVSPVAAGPVTEPSWNWVRGPVYLGAAGQLTQTPPAAPAVFCAQVGYASAPTTVHIDRQPSIRLT